MRDNPNPRNPVVTRFASGAQPRHQVHADRRQDRRIKHKRPFWEGEE